MSDDKPNQTVSVRVNSFQVSKSVVACVALLVAAFGMYVYLDQGSSAQAKKVNQSTISHKRVDFDMFPGRYRLNMEAVDMQFEGSDPMLQSIFSESFKRNFSNSKEICLSSKNSKYNVFSDGFAINCIVDENRSAPGVIDVVQTCSSPDYGSGDMTLRTQGNLTTEAAEVILVGELDVASAGRMKAVFKTTLERIGDCPA